MLRSCTRQLDNIVHVYVHRYYFTIRQIQSCRIQTIIIIIIIISVWIVAAIISNIFTSIIITIIVFIMITSLSELINMMVPKRSWSLSLPLPPISLSSFPSFPPISLLPIFLCWTQPVEADGRPHRVWFWWRFLPVNEGFLSVHSSLTIGFLCNF